MKALEDLKLKELRKLHPEISARSKEEFLTELASSLEVVLSDEEIATQAMAAAMEQSENDDIVPYLLNAATTKKKILIKTTNSAEADNLFAILQFELFPELAALEIGVVASSSRRDMHLNGTCYVRVCCEKNYELYKTLNKYTDFKQV